MKQIFLLSLCILTAPAVQAQNDEPRTSSSSGYYNLTQLSFITGEPEEISPISTNLVPSVTVVNGYRFNEYFSMGAGVGVTAYAYLVYPLFADIRWNVFKDGFTPVLAFRGGYAFAGNDKPFLGNSAYYYEGSYENSGGWMCNPEIGFKTTINPHFDFLLSVGYYYQGLESKITTEGGYSRAVVHNINTDVNRLTFTIGFLFK